MSTHFGWAAFAMYAAICTIAVNTPALADDRPFAFAYTTDIEAQGEKEIGQQVTWSSGHAGEAYQAIESRTELEYGFTDNFQGSFYLNHDWSRANPHQAIDSIQTVNLTGVSGEFIYRLTNVYFDPVGLALYFEPTISNDTRSFEVKALIQKNFLNDTLRFVLNVNIEDRWEKGVLGNFEKSSALEFYSGIAYNVTPDWSVGAEFDNERGYDGLVLGGAPKYTDNAYFVGPTIQYAGKPFRVVVGAQTQLPWASDPTHTPGTILNGYLGSAERFRVRMRLEKDF